MTKFQSQRDYAEYLMTKVVGMPAFLEGIQSLFRLARLSGRCPTEQQFVEAARKVADDLRRDMEDEARGRRVS